VGIAQAAGRGAPVGHAPRAGLLCDVGKVLWEEHVDLGAAKIGTMGERAEDVFYLTDRTRRPLDEAAAERLRARLLEALSQRQNA
jgi:[protein-PII] uridylyltransferase